MSVLSQSAQFELFKHFGFQSGRDMNKFEKFEKCARAKMEFTISQKEQMRIFL